MTVEQLIIAWIVIGKLRNEALRAADFDRAVVYSHVMEDLAAMIQALGGTIPPADVLED